MQPGPVLHPEKSVNQMIKVQSETNFSIFFPKSFLEKS